MRRTRRTAALAVSMSCALLLPACGSSSSKADTAAEQACHKFAQVTREIHSGKVKGADQIRSSVAEIEKLASSSKDDAVKKAVQDLSTAAQQGSADIKSASQGVIKACKDSGVTLGGGGATASPT